MCQLLPLPLEHVSTVAPPIKTSLTLTWPQVKLRACIYHAGDTMCSIVNWPERQLEGDTAKWEESVTFDISLHDIPRMARLCFMLYEATSTRGKGRRKVGDTVVCMRWLGKTHRKCVCYGMQHNTYVTNRVPSMWCRICQNSCHGNRVLFGIILDISETCKLDLVMCVWCVPQ